MKTAAFPPKAGMRACILVLLALLGTFSVKAQVAPPTVTVRLANPVYDCRTFTYCLDVEFQSPTPGVQVFGMNVRFFFPENELDLIGFTDYEPGYGPVSPNPPEQTPNMPLGPAWFNFTGPAVFVNGAIQRTDPTQPPIFLPANGWVRLYSICFSVNPAFAGPGDFCPPVVWDLEANPANGGYLTGDDGVVISRVDPANPFASLPTSEQVVQYNWAYSAPPNPPFGVPQSTTCLIADCVYDIALSKDVLMPPDTIRPGDIVDFLVTVSNESNTPLDEITIVDYIPLGLILLDPEWTPGIAGSTGQSGTILLSEANTLLPVGGLLPGASIQVPITLGVRADAPFGWQRNVAEIQSMYNLDGIDVSNQDIDSTPDDDDLNDPPGEDDIDDALICIYVAPALTGPPVVCNESTTEYQIPGFDPAYGYAFDFSAPAAYQFNAMTGILTVYWNQGPGATITITVTAVAGNGCEASGTFQVRIHRPVPIACIDHVNISIDNECGTIVSPSMVLSGIDPATYDWYHVFVIDINGDTLPGGLLTYEHVGHTFMISVVDDCTGQSCWSWATIEDKLPPRIQCNCPTGNEDERCTITCLQVDDFLDGNIPAPYRPVVTDNCGNATLVLTNVQFDNQFCEGGTITVSWLATDNVGLTATCTQEFRIRPLNTDLVIFPADVHGACGNPSDPDHTGWPTLQGVNITTIPTYCNMLADYQDQEVPLCGNGRKIVRLWRLIDWCNNRTLTSVQQIYLKDTEGPVIPPQAPITVNALPWSCDADLIVPRPQATDACSQVAHYQLFSPNGLVVETNGQYIVNDLPVGTHTLRWYVSDECYNVSSAEVTVTVRDISPPAVACHSHTVVALTEERLGGISLVPASAFDDGSRDNCSDITLRVRRMDSCIDVDWTTHGGCQDEHPNGTINDLDRGTEWADCVPFACCDVGGEPIMVQLEVSDAEGNVNYCMVEVEVQDKLAPKVSCPPDIIVSSEFLFNAQNGMYTDTDGDGSLDEDPLSALFGNVYDASRYDEADRGDVILHDPANELYPQPHNWGKEGWATDYCRLDLSVETTVIEDCSGAAFPANAPDGAIKRIRRVFRANDGYITGSCAQDIYVVDFTPFYISDTSCHNDDPNDGVIWPCDVLLTACAENMQNAGAPVIVNAANRIIGVASEDEAYAIADGACYKILRTWRVIDWCSFDANTGAGMWSYVQEIKVLDQTEPEFLGCPAGPVTLCTDDPGVRLPSNNQIFIGEEAPQAVACGVHVTMTQPVRDLCSTSVIYDVKLYPFNGDDFIQVRPETVVQLDGSHEAILSFDTETIPALAAGVPYNDPGCGDYHRVLWSLEDGCGNRSYCEYMLRLEDCKAPVPVCLNGISTVVMGGNGSVTVDAASFEASSVDDCTPSDQLVFSFSGTAYQPTQTFTCENIPGIGVEIPVSIWVADGGADQNCNGQIEWNERNASECVTYIIITDPTGACNEGLTGGLVGQVLTTFEEAVTPVTVNITSGGMNIPAVVTAENGKFQVTGLPANHAYRLTPERLDDPRNGVSTLDLVRIQKHLLGQETFTDAYQYIAADANRSGSVSAIDLIGIRKLILGLADEFDNNTSWRFVREGAIVGQGQPWQLEESLEVSPKSGQTIDGLDFIGVKVGDVNGSARANAQQLEARDARPVVKVMAIESPRAAASDIVQVKLVLPRNLAGFQWTLEVDGWTFLSATSRDIPFDESNYGIPADGAVTMSWNGDMGQSAQDGDAALLLTFRADKAASLSDILDLSGRITAAEAYTTQGEILDVELVTDETQVHAAFALYQNLPNPFRDQTLIGFDLPEAGEAVLTVYDASGKAVFRQAANYPAGYNSVLLQDSDIRAEGVLYYQLEAFGLSASRKMVMMR